MSRWLVFTLAPLLASGCEIHLQAPVETSSVTIFQDDDADPSALDDFRADLDPYGAWVEDAEWGSVWVPDDTEIPIDFEPYLSGGCWTWNGYYVWASDYPWGRVAFHYGRWVLTRSRGWAWIPGHRYASAWVVWSIDDGHVGWAPTPPRYKWHGHHAVAVHPLSPRYVYLPNERLFDPWPHEHVIARSDRVQTSTPPPSPSDLGLDPNRLPRAVPRVIYTPTTPIPSQTLPQPLPRSQTTTPQVLPSVEPRPQALPRALPQPQPTPQPLPRALPQPLPRVQPQPSPQPVPRALPQPQPSPQPVPRALPQPPPTTTPPPSMQRAIPHR